MGKYRKERIREKFIKCGHFTYDKETHYICGKPCTAWGSLCGFYLLYVAIVIGVFFGMLYWMVDVIYQEGISGLYDKKQLYKGASPALEIFPKLPEYNAPMMWYSQSEGTISRDHYVDYMDVYLSQYENLNESVYVDCSKQKRRINQYCKFTTEDLGPCGVANYGYDEDKPCIYLKLNKLMGWDPKKYRPKMNIDEESRIGNEMIMVTCKALSHFDAEKLGPITYYPANGFFEYFFPFDGSKEYLAPLIGIQFTKLVKDYVIGLKCLTFDVGVSTGLLNADVIYIYVKTT